MIQRRHGDLGVAMAPLGAGALRCHGTAAPLSIGGFHSFFIFDSSEFTRRDVLNRQHGGEAQCFRMRRIEICLSSNQRPFRVLKAAE